MHTHLKCMTNSRVFPFSKTLATRGDMLPCDAQGHIATGHIADAEAGENTVRRVKTRYLGNPANGRLYPYTDILAERGDMVSIDTEAQWASMQDSPTEWRKEPPVEAPTLSRSAVHVDEDKIKTGEEPLMPHKITPVMPDALANPDLPPSGEVPDYDRIGNATTLPDTQGLPAREAKSILADWAQKFHNHRIDRRPVLGTVIDECRAIIPIDPE